MKRKIRSASVVYESHDVDIINPSELLPKAQHPVFSVPSFVVVVREKGMVEWDGESPFNHPQRRKPGSDEFECEPDENAFLDFLRLADASTPMDVKVFVEKWGPLCLYPVSVDLNGRPLKGEYTSHYTTRAQLCKAFIDVLADLNVGKRGKRSDWIRIRHPESSQTPIHEDSIEWQRRTLLSEMSHLLHKAGIVPYLQVRDGETIVALGWYPNTPLIRAWDEAQRQQQPLKMKSLAPWLPEGLAEDEIPRPSELWGTILLRLATILATPHGLRRCKKCQTTFTPIHGNQRYCEVCGEESERNRLRVAECRERKRNKARTGQEPSPDNSEREEP